MIRVSAREFDRAVEAALAEIPPAFAPYMDNVVIEVRERPTADLLEGDETVDDLLGLYLGVPVEEKMAEDFELAALPDRVLIFRANLCAMCESYDELVEEIRVTVLHEIGHHFGMDEDQLADLGYD